ncbi:MAG: CPBP family intramembrane metalloprotease [Acidobacteria bacterium]|nr:CPBP family intramembrane metalloprotease [Acidobacteriota bacterium]
MQSYSEIEPRIRQAELTQSPFSLGMGLATWGVSVALIVGIQVVLGVGYVVWFMAKSGGAAPTAENILNKEFALLALGSTLVAHALTVLFCWLLITKRLQLPFLQTQGWSWHPQFKLMQAVILGVLMIGVAIACSKLLPHHETEMEKMLKLGTSVRVLTAILAVFSAPFVEEFVYRGILYPAIESRAGWQMGVAVTSLLFALVHVPQYWGSPAAITIIMILSVALTMVRAFRFDPAHGGDPLRL